MNEYILILAAAVLIPLAVFTSKLANAASHPYEFHADAKMKHESLGPVEKTYGYMNVVTDTDGKGTINVMFSNGSQLPGARFNARVKFMDASGSVIKEEYFNQWIDASGYVEAVESKVTKPLNLSDFDSIKVDFYLSDIPKLSATAAAY